MFVLVVAVTLLEIERYFNKGKVCSTRRSCYTKRKWEGEEGGRRKEDARARERESEKRKAICIDV